VGVPEKRKHTHSEQYRKWKKIGRKKTSYEGKAQIYTPILECTLRPMGGVYPGRGWAQPPYDDFIRG